MVEGERAALAPGAVQAQRVVYSPASGFSGIATFAYTARDAHGGISGAATVTISVGQQPFDLQIVTTPSNDEMTIGQEVFFDVLVSLLGGTVSRDVEAIDRLPDAFAYLRHEASVGSYDPETGQSV